MFCIFEYIVSSTLDEVGYADIWNFHGFGACLIATVATLYSILMYSFHLSNGGVMLIGCALWAVKYLVI